MEPFAIQLLLQGGLEFFNNAILELKWKPKDDPESSDEEPPKKDEGKPTDEELATLKSIVDGELPPPEWLKKLFVEHRKLYIRWQESQENKVDVDMVKMGLQCPGLGLEKLVEKEFEGDAQQLLDQVDEITSVVLFTTL